MPTDTKGLKYEDVWVVYAWLKPSYSVMGPETHWDKFESEFDALKKVEEWKANPRLDKVEEPQKYKLYRLEGRK